MRKGGVKKSIKRDKNLRIVFIFSLIIILLLILGLFYYFYSFRLTGNVVYDSANGDCVNVRYGSESWNGINNSLGVTRSISPSAVSFSSSLLCSNNQFYACNIFSNAIQSALSLGNTGSWQLKASADLNKDNTPDLFWQNPNGDVAVWFMYPNGSMINSRIISSNIGVWQLKASADLNKDNTPDLFWQNPNGDVAVWFMYPNGTLLISKILGNTGSWQLKASADLNKDNTPDLFWQNPNGDVAVWFMYPNGTAINSFPLGSNIGVWQLKASADLNKDNTPDLFWQNPNGDVAVWFMYPNGSMINSIFIGSNLGAWQLKAVSDLNKNNISNLFWQDSSGNAAVWLLNQTKLLINPPTTNVPLGFVKGSLICESGGWSTYSLGNCSRATTADLAGKWGYMDFFGTFSTEDVLYLVDNYNLGVYYFNPYDPIDPTIKNRNLDLKRLKERGLILIAHEQHDNANSWPLFDNPYIDGMVIDIEEEASSFDIDAVPKLSTKLHAQGKFLAVTSGITDYTEVSSIKALVKPYADLLLPFWYYLDSTNGFFQIRDIELVYPEKKVYAVGGNGLHESTISMSPSFAATLPGWIKDYSFGQHYVVFAASTWILCSGINGHTSQECSDWSKLKLGYPSWDFIEHKQDYLNLLNNLRNNYRGVVVPCSTTVAPNVVTLTPTCNSSNLGSRFGDLYCTTTGWETTPLSRSLTNPILVGTEQWEKGSSKYYNVYEPTVVIDSNAPISQKYKMLYSAGWYNSSTGLAYSPDLIHWTKYENNPVLGQANLYSGRGSGITGLTDRNSVIFDNGSWYIYYSGSEGDLHRAKSTDLIHWTPDGRDVRGIVVGKSDKPWSWGWHNTGVWKDERGVWNMYVDGYKRAGYGPQWFEAYANSSDGKNWNFYPDSTNPSFEPMPSLRVAPLPAIYGSLTPPKKVNGLYFVFYHAGIAAVPNEIYLAYSANVNGPWTIYKNAPILKIANENNVSDVVPVDQLADAWWFEDNGKSYLFYDVDNNADGANGKVHISLATYNDTLNSFFSSLDIPEMTKTCTSFTYSSWSTCNSSGLQTRNVTSQSPSGCSGGILENLTQSCTADCRDLPSILSIFNSAFCSVSCTNFTYSSWNSCNSSGLQSRNLTSQSPSGCSGGLPENLTQSCNYVAPVVTCTNFTYSDWSACLSSGVQTHNVLTSLPANCQGGNPDLQRTCNYIPSCTAANWDSQDSACQSNNQLIRTWTLSGSCLGGVNHSSSEIVYCTYTAPTCTNFTYSDWSACLSSGVQTHNVLTSLPANCQGGNPDLQRTCNYIPPVVTCTNFTYTLGACSVSCGGGTQTMTVATQSPSGCSGGTPQTSQTCNTQACAVVPVNCTSFNYSSWSICNSSGLQSRNILSQSPSGCSGGSSNLIQTCMPPCSASDWQYTDNPCYSNNTLVRNWNLIGICNITLGVNMNGLEIVACNYSAPLCTNFTYSNWSDCSPSGVQNRTVILSLPANCQGGNSNLTDSCNYTYPVTSFVSSGSSGSSGGGGSSVNKPGSSGGSSIDITETGTNTVSNQNSSGLVENGSQKENSLIKTFFVKLLCIISNPFNQESYGACISQYLN